MEIATLPFLINVGCDYTGPIVLPNIQPMTLNAVNWQADGNTDTTL